ncbi:MAG: hypothetical protein J3K34DRAFT_515949 [Monoraphidium minutum]|nr:MAG: hypothetical protein J3K34DRAFT_515949 [Monoraphidium minutum]
MEPADEDAGGASGGFRAVPVESASELSYDAFISNYMAPNRPVLIQGAAAAWPAARDWALPCGGVDIDALAGRAPAARVRVTDAARHHAGCGPCTEMTLSEYRDWWHEGRPRGASPGGAAGGLHGNQHEQQQQRQGCQQPAGGAWPDQPPGRPAGADGRLLYLKDFHYCAECPGGTPGRPGGAPGRPGGAAYRLPAYFREDWLNAHCDGRAAAAAAGGEGQGSGGEGGGGGGGCESGAGGGAAAAASTADYRFVYCGPAGSWTPLHADVLRSYSWSANAAGAKHWLLLPPAAAGLLGHRRRRGELPPDFFLEDLTALRSGACVGGGGGGCEDGGGGEEEGAVDPGDYPGLAAARKLLYEVVQGPGDALFVPSGWHHTVVNLTDCISINHNWLNAHNAHWAWRLLEREHALATASLEDCRDTCGSGEEFEALVQRALAANAGLGFSEWGALLSRAARDALGRLGGGHGGGGAAESGGEEGSGGEAARLQAALELARAAALLRALLSAAARAARRNAEGAAAAAAAGRDGGGGRLRARVFEVRAAEPAPGGCGGGGCGEDDPAPSDAPGGGLRAPAPDPLADGDAAWLPAWGAAAAALLSEALAALEARGAA